MRVYARNFTTIANEFLVYRISKRLPRSTVQINVPGTVAGSSTCSVSSMEFGANEITTADVHQNPSRDVHQLRNTSGDAHQLFQRQGLPHDEKFPDPHTSLSMVDLNVPMQTASFSNLTSVERPRLEEQQATGSACSKVPPLRRHEKVTQISVVE